MELWGGICKWLGGLEGLTHWFQSLGSIPYPTEGGQVRGLSLGVCLSISEQESVTRLYPDPVGLYTCGTQWLGPLIPDQWPYSQLLSQFVRGNTCLWHIINPPAMTGIRHGGDRAIPPSLHQLQNLTKIWKTVYASLMAPLHWQSGVKRQYQQTE